MYPFTHLSPTWKRALDVLLRGGAGILVLTCLLLSAATVVAESVAASNSLPDCHVAPVNYQGWNAQQISNAWLQAVIVPQNGGRLMQVTFGGHPFLFVNPKYAGKYLPPTSGQWFNYGGDKLWLLPEGNNDEQHWAGGSDVIDDGPFSFRKLSEGRHCEVELTGPPDPVTGVQISRTIALDADSPGVRFHASLKNVSGHKLEWSMQSVSQYDTSLGNPATMNHDFWTFTPANPASGYLNRYHVRFGPAENAAASIRDDGLFMLHYAHLAAELWLDSSAGWLAVVDRNRQYAMVERFRYEAAAQYPGKASVIFWTNGPEVHVNEQGEPALRTGDEGDSPYYLEAEINSPLCNLQPGESCSLHTEWYPTRVGMEFHGAADPGLISEPLRVNRMQNGTLRFSGVFGVFFPGRLLAHLYDEHGSRVGTIPVADVRPDKLVSLTLEMPSPRNAARVSLHLEDLNGLDRGVFQEVQIVSDGTAVR